MKNTSLYIFVIIFLIFCSCSWSGDDTVEVDFSPSGSRTRVYNSVDSLPVLSVAIAPVISPKESFIFYKQLFDYMGEELGMKIEFRQRMSYMEVNNMLERNMVDMAFICTGSYVEGSDRMDLLVAPIVGGRPYYNAYVIVNANSDIETIEDLKGRTFAFTDPLSTAGRVYPLRKIMDLGEDTTAFFSNTVYSGSHDVSIQMVSRNLIDGASISSLIYSYLEVSSPDFISNVRIIDRSDPMGIPPIVISLLLDGEMKQKMQQMFLEMHNDERGRQILEKLLIDRFELTSDSLYDNVRNLTNTVWP